MMRWKRKGRHARMTSAVGTSSKVVRILYFVSVRYVPDDDLLIRYTILQNRCFLNQVLIVDKIIAHTLASSLHLYSEIGEDDFKKKKNPVR